MKEIVIKNGNKTTYKFVPDDYVEPQKDTPQRDLTTTACQIISMGMSKEQYDSIFHKTQAHSE